MPYTVSDAQKATNQTPPSEAEKIIDDLQDREKETQEETETQETEENEENED